MSSLTQGEYGFDEMQSFLPLETEESKGKRSPPSRPKEKKTIPTTPKTSTLEQSFWETQRSTTKDSETLSTSKKPIVGKGMWKVRKGLEKAVVFFLLS